MTDAPAPSPASPRIPTAEDLNAASVIDPEALARWFTLDAEKDVVLNISRLDMDTLFLALRNMAFAQGDSLSAIQLATVNPEGAAFHFARAAERHHLALQQITKWTSRVMARATSDG